MRGRFNCDRPAGNRQQRGRQGGKRSEPSKRQRMGTPILRQASRQQHKRRRQRREQQAWAEDLRRVRQRGRREAAGHGRAAVKTGRPICSNAKNEAGANPSATAKIASARAIASRLRRGRDFNATRVIREGRRQHPIDVARGQQPPRQHHRRPQPLPGSDGRFDQQPFRREAAARGQAHQRQSAESESKKRHRHRPAGAGKAGDPVVAEGFGDQAGRQEHRRLGEGVREGLHHAAAPAVRRPRMRAGGERKHQEQIADLRDGRIGDQEFQPFLTQREHAAKQDRRRTKRRRDLR